MIFIRLFSADTPETSTVPGCEQITVLQLRNVESRAAVLKWLLTAGCKRWRRNEWRIFIINILLLWLQARILVFSGERILSPSPSLSPALLSSSSLSLPNLFLFKFTLTLASLALNPELLLTHEIITKTILSTNRSGCRGTPTGRHVPSLLSVTQQQDAGFESKESNNRNTDLYLLISTKHKVQLSFAGVVLQNVSCQPHVFVR